MAIIDAQLHIWELDHPGRPWDRPRLEIFLEDAARGGLTFDVSKIMTAEAVLERMAAVGVDAAVLITFGAFYPVDNSYVLESAATYPDRFAAIPVLDGAAPDIDRQVETVAAQPEVVGVRSLVLNEERIGLFRGGALDPLYAAAVRHDLVVCLLPLHCLPDVERVATAFPELRIVIDHFGIAQPPLTVGADPWSELPDLLALGRLENVAVKLSGLPTIAAEPYPYLDLWPRIHQVLEAFGPERVMWGTDNTRTALDYGQELRYVSESAELSEREKKLVLGESLCRVFQWQPAALGASGS